MSTAIPNAFFQKYVVYGTKGEVDVKRSVSAFTEDFTAWCKEQTDLKPAILQELTEYKRLGEGKLINFTLHQLRLAPTKENMDRITNALQELQRAGKIVYKTTEGAASKFRAGMIRATRSRIARARGGRSRSNAVTHRTQ